MLILRLGSTCSLQVSDMPPSKKLKTEASDPEIVNVASSESEAETVDFGSDWRDRCKTLSDKYNYALKNNVLTDVKLLVGERGVSFHCHRLILALGSPVFEAMFFGELAERGDTVTIPDVDPEGFQNLVRFLYTGLYEPRNDVSAFKTYFAADKYCVSELKKHCENFLCRYEVSPVNVWMFFENALFLNSQAIKNRCLDVLKRQLKHSLEQTTFLDINFNTMETLLSLDDLNVSEEKILKNVIAWAEYQSELEGADTFENTLKPLLSNIRFKGLTPEEFVNLRHGTRLREVLNEEDSLAILEHLIDPVMCNLPDWCCSKTRQPAGSNKGDTKHLLSVIQCSSSSKSRREKKSKHKSDNYKRDRSLYSESSYSSSSCSSSDID